MDSYRLPAFAPVERDELRRIWAKYPDPEIRRLALEIERYRRVLSLIDAHYKHVHQAWRDTVGGNLVALHELQQVMTQERQRLPNG